MTRSAEQTTSAVWRGAIRGGIDSISRAAIDWKSRMLLAISLTLLVLSCLAFDSATLRNRLPVVLLAMVAGIVVASLVLSRLRMGCCVSCGSSPTDLVWKLDDCPAVRGASGSPWTAPTTRWSRRHIASPPACLRFIRRKRM